MRDESPESPEAACPPRRRLSPAAGQIVGKGIDVLSLLLFAAAAARMAAVAYGQLLEPHDLVYESPNLRTIEMLAAGRPIYAASVYDEIPFVFTMYPPLYHVLVAALPSSPTNPYFTGRLVSCIAMLAATATLPLVGGRAGLPAALLCIACLWLFHPVTHMTAFLKPDSLGLYLSAMAVSIAARRADPWAAVAAAGLATLAIWTKHSCLAAALACFCVFLVRGGAPRLWFMVTAALLALLSWCIASAAWGGGLVWCLRAGVSLPVFWEQARAVWVAAARQPLFLVLFVTVHAAVVLHVWRTGIRVWHSPSPWYLLWADVLVTVGLGKPGSSVNYFFEPLLAGGMCLAGARQCLPAPAAWLFSALLLTAGAWESFTGDARNYDLRLLGCPHANRTEQSAWIRGQRAAAEARSDAVVASTNATPRLLNLCNARFGSDLPGTISLNDPFLYYSLFTVGRLHPDSLIRCIDNASFDAILLPPDHDPLRIRRSPALKALYDAVHRNYAPFSQPSGLAIWVHRQRMMRPDTLRGDAGQSPSGWLQKRSMTPDPFEAERP